MLFVYPSTFRKKNDDSITKRIQTINGNKYICRITDDCVICFNRMKGRNVFDVSLDLIMWCVNNGKLYLAGQPSFYCNRDFFRKNASIIEAVVNIKKTPRLVLPDKKIRQRQFYGRILSIAVL
jgi:hypothetical protein